MKNKDLMKAMSDIDDKYIEEASEVKKPGKEKISSYFRGGRWTKWAGAVAAVLVIALVGNGLINSGLFSNKGSKGDVQSTDSFYEPGDAASPSPSFVEYEGLDFDHRKNSVNYSGSNSLAQTDGQSGWSANSEKPVGTGNISYDTSKVKLIYTANISGQTDDFATADAQLRAKVEAAGGYFQDQNISNGSYYNGDYLKKASYTIRIPADRFEAFLSGVKEGITVKSLTQSAEDIGLSYSETEQRIETLNIKLDRLQELLRQATVMSDIIELENAISETEEEIEYYTNRINKYDSLIGFSTIYLDLTEVARPGSSIEEKEGFFKKLGREFVEGLSNAGESLAGIFYWISYHFVGLLIFAGIVFCLIKFRPFTKLFKKIFKKE